MDELSRRLVPDKLWALVAPLIPPVKTRPQGGGMSRVDDRAYRYQINDTAGIRKRLS